MVAYRELNMSTVENSIAKKVRYYEQKHNYQQRLFYDSTVMQIENQYGERVTKVVGSIPNTLPVGKGDTFLFISTDQSKYLHGVHRYPAKFYPELPRWLIEVYSNESDTVLDPFAGSGTTNLEALLLGRNSIALDIEEFCRLLIRVKTTPLEPTELMEYNQRLIFLLQNYNPNLVDQDLIPIFPYRDSWFQDFIIHELAFIKQSIDSINAPLAIRDFIRICFSSVVRSVSNADDGCTRTVIRKKLKKKVYPSMAIARFIEVLMLNSYRMSEFYSISKHNISTCNILKDSDALNICLESCAIDCAITSPPYVNAVDYPRTHQLELYWLGLESGSLTPLKRKHVGTEAVLKEDYQDLKLMGIGLIDAALQKIAEADMRRSYIAYKYLQDMKQNLCEVHRVLKPGGRYVVVVGNNKIRGYLFENWKYLSLIAESIGYEIETWFTSEVIKHFIKVPREERINQDYIIVLRKKINE